ncbi:MAG: hypothetical protein AMXMBFR12_03110 [Candidatus Babeliales bacterium]
MKYYFLLLSIFFITFSFAMQNKASEILAAHREVRRANHHILQGILTRNRIVAINVITKERKTRFNRMNQRQYCGRIYRRGTKSSYAISSAAAQVWAQRLEEQLPTSFVHPSLFSK